MYADLGAEAGKEAPTGLGPEFFTFCPGCPLIAAMEEEAKEDPRNYFVHFIPEFSHEADDPRYPSEQEAWLVGLITWKGGKSKYLLLGVSGDETLDELADEAAYATQRCPKPIITEPGKLARLVGISPTSKCGAGIISIREPRRLPVSEANYTIR